jgi:co-chaperonin GroES (HSP10)
MMIKPCGNQLLIKREEVEQVTESGIIQHTDAQQIKEQNGQNKGRVISLGPLVHDDFQNFPDDTPTGRAKFWGYEVGDLVLFSRYDGQSYELPGCEELVLMSASCIVGKLEE